MYPKNWQNFQIEMGRGKGGGLREILVDKFCWEIWKLFVDGPLWSHFLDEDQLPQGYRTEPLQRDCLFFTTKSPEIP